MLTAKAEQRLQITTEAVAKQAVPRTRTVGGFITVPDGARLTVTAPWTGTLLRGDSAESVRAGDVVESGATVFQLLPLLSPEREVPTAAERVAMANARASLVSSRITADGDTRQAAAQVLAAEIALKRADQLLQDKAGSQRDVDDAIARLDIAKKGHEAAAARKELLDKLTLEAENGQVTSIPIEAPQSGILQAVSSSIRQTVSVGTPLFDIVNLQTVWVRVPIYPGLRKQLDPDAAAIIQDLAGNKPFVRAEPASAPPGADPLAATVDLFYQLPNVDTRFHPGERVEVKLAIAGEDESLVIPRAAILRDIHGIAWVYVNSAEHTFERHRVEVHFTVGELAVLSRGPNVGTKIVVDGAAELFGTEFGAGK